MEFKSLLSSLVGVFLKFFWMILFWSFICWGKDPNPRSGGFFQGELNSETEKGSLGPNPPASPGGSRFKGFGPKGSPTPTPMDSQFSKGQKWGNGVTGNESGGEQGQGDRNSQLQTSGVGDKKSQSPEGGGRFPSIPPKVQKNKLSFADAQPEDITNENFPEIIESFDYRNADIADVANAMAKLTRKNFIFEPGVKGKISIIAPTKITVAEAWEAFLSALAMNDYTIVKAGKFLKIRRTNKASKDAVEIYSGEYYPTSDQLITRIIKLKYIQAEDIKKNLERFTSDKGGVLAYEETNSLIISGYGSNVERISKIIEELDKPGFEEQMEVIPIQHAKSTDMAQLIEKIIKEGGGLENKRSRFRSSRIKKKSGKMESLKLVVADERTNAIIVVGNDQGIQRIKKLVARLDYPLDPSDSGGVYVYYVKHGEAVKIAETLSGIAQDSGNSNSKSSRNKSATPLKVQKPIFGGNVIIKADENTNSLIVTASRPDYKVVQSLLSKIDIPKDQVFVEAVIMEMEANDTNLWNMNYMKFFPSGGNIPGADGIARAGFTGGKIAGLLSPTAGQGLVLNIGDPNSEKILLPTPAGNVEIPSLLALISFLKKKANANILSTPNIIAMDNEESEIEVGDEVPVGGAQNFAQTGALTITPQFKNATILLKIKPFISRDTDIVRLNVVQNVKKVNDALIRASQLAQTTQALTTKSIKTNIVLKSGQTAVLGGLMEDEDRVEETKVPLLGDIPILGWLFRNREVRSVKKNLLVFLTPTIIRNTEDHKKVLNKALGRRVDWIRKNTGGVDRYGAKFNSLIQTSSDSEVSPYDSGVELDIEEAVPFESNILEPVAAPLNDTQEAKEAKNSIEKKEEWVEPGVEEVPVEEVPLDHSPVEEEGAGESSSVYSD